MFSIGEFSKINKITPKTLRHYDRIGLLKPAKIDEWTGYRYYAREQLQTIQQILRLKDFGLNLPEIGDVLASHEPETVIALLQKKQRELNNVIRADQQRLERLSAFLVGMQGEREMEQKVEIKKLPEVIVASMRTVVPNYDAYFDIVPKMGEYMQSVGAVCREPAYCFTIYHDGEYRESDIDVEICEAVVEVREESEKVKFKTIKACEQAACLYHKGPYTTIGETYNALFQWIADNGLTPADNPRESYIDGIWNKEDPQEWLTEIQVPVQ